jgi:hypothetical protein
MNDVVLSRLLGALDATVAGSVAPALGADCELAALRLRCLQERLGQTRVANSPYLDQLRQTIAADPYPAESVRMAASA